MPLSAEEPAAGRQTEQKFTGKGGSIDYLLWLPEKPAEGKPPLLMFLHGAGERGDDLQMVKKHGPPKLVESEPVLQQFIVVAPQCPAGQRWNVALLKELLDHVVSRHQPDTSRLYLTGLSMGGMGTWAMLAAHPDIFAAAIPICGPTDPADAPKIKHIPIRVYHGDQDQAVPVSESQEMAAALEKAGARDFKLEVFPGVGHDSWTQVYEKPETYRWLLEHRLEKGR